VIRIVGQEQMGWAVPGNQPGPVRLAEEGADPEAMLIQIEPRE
jgi:hypothetical protein